MMNQFIGTLLSTLRALPIVFPLSNAVVVILRYQ